MPTKNDEAWERYIAAQNLQLDGRVHRIEAELLKDVSKREPRLMTKFDTPNQLPEVLKRRNYTILPVSNGEYLLFQGDIFFPLERCKQRRIFQTQIGFPLLTVGRGIGESEYLDNAFNSGLLADFVQEERLYLTIRGRERTRQFDFRLNSDSPQIQVNGVQIESDAGYEGPHDIILVEAKIGTPSDFNIRQLYYPYRHFSIIAPKKRIRSLFFLYDLSTATYTFHEFIFTDTYDFRSIRQIDCQVYTLTEPQAYRIDELLDMRFATDNQIVPQADDLNKIFELLTLINRGQNKPGDIADYFVFDTRQSNYYGEAAEYLGLITRATGTFDLTARGLEFITTEPEQRQLFIAKLIVNSWIFRAIIDLARTKRSFTNREIDEVIRSAKKEDGTSRYSKSTVTRRRKTIIAWIRWLAQEFSVFTCKNDEYHLS